MRTLKIWGLGMLSTIILSFLIFTFVQDKKQLTDFVVGALTPLSILVHVFFYCLIVLIVGATLFALAYASTHVWKHIHHSEISEIGQYGSVIVKHGKPTTVLPYIPNTTKEIATKTKEVAEKLIIPTLKELLTSGYITNLLRHGEMLLGYRQEDGSERTGTIEDNRTTGIAGKSRSGKTVTMAYLIIQYVLAGATVYLVDKAWNKSSSLYHLLLPLIEAGYIKVARKPMEIVQVVDEFTTSLDNRENGTEDMSKTKILVFDEWTSFMHDKLMVKKLVSIVHRIANESAGYNAYALIGGQNWQASQAGGNALINSLHSFFVHKIDELESKRILIKKFAKLTSTLRVGYNFFKDTSGDIDALITPLTTVEDSIIALAILEGKFIAGNKVSAYRTPEYYQPAFQPYNPKLLETRKEQIANGLTPISPVSPNSDMVAIQLPEQTTGIRVNNVAPVKPTLISEDGRIYVTSKEQDDIEKAIQEALLVGKVKANGKVVRTHVRDILEYDNKAYPKIQLYCDIKGY